MASENIDRRRVAKGVAWSVPVVVAASVAPAVAASPSPQLSVYGRATWNRSWYGERVDGYGSFKLFTIIPGSIQPGRGFCVENTKTSTQISNASVTYYLPYYSGLSFSPQDGPGFNGWSRLARDNSKSSKSYKGVTYYAYTTVYTGGVTAQGGTTCLPAYGFESTDGLSSTGYIFVDNSVIINGRTAEANFGPVRMIS